MRLGMISENVHTNIWYHVALAKHRQSIQKYGLIKGTVGNNPKNSGEGIYFFQPYTNDDQVVMAIALSMEEYLGFDRSILVTVDLSGHKLLMDEDALVIGEFRDISSLSKIMPPQAVQEYTQFIHENDGDELAVNDPLVAKFKTDLIDKYQIAPNADWLVDVFRYNLLTCRVKEPVTTILDIKNISYLDASI